jgi:hypothetical protein
MRGWQQAFENPVVLPDGRQLVTLRQAADYILKLPKAEQNLEPWQTAIGCLIGAAEGRDFLMQARIGMLQALNRHVETPQLESPFQLPSASARMATRRRCLVSRRRQPYRAPRRSSFPDAPSDTPPCAAR